MVSSSLLVAKQCDRMFIQSLVTIDRISLCSCPPSTMLKGGSHRGRTAKIEVSERFTYNINNAVVKVKYSEYTFLFFCCCEMKQSTMKYINNRCVIRLLKSVKESYFFCATESSLVPSLFFFLTEPKRFDYNPLGWLQTGWPEDSGLSFFYGMHRQPTSGTHPFVFRGYNKSDLFGPFSKMFSSLASSCPRLMDHGAGARTTNRICPLPEVISLIFSTVFTRNLQEKVVTKRGYGCKIISHPVILLQGTYKWGVGLRTYRSLNMEYMMMDHYSTHLKLKREGYRKVIPEPIVTLLSENFLNRN